MKNFLALFLCLITLHACNSQEGTKNPVQMEQEKPTKLRTDLNKQKACDMLSKTEVARLLGVEVDALVEEDMSFAESNRRSICHYVVKGEVASYNLRLGWKSDKAVENKILEKSYIRYLASGEKNMKSYEELTNKNGIQILYGEQDEAHGTRNHIIRKRYGNKAELKIEILKEARSNENVKDLLVKLINDM